MFREVGQLIGQRVGQRVGLLAISTLLFAGCGDDSAVAFDAMPSPECIAAVDHSDLAWLEENVFAASCGSFSVCHKGAARSAGGLNLEAGNVESSLVGQPSLEYPTRTLVVPGDVENSFVMVVLGSRAGQLPDAGTMPLNNPLLCKAKRDAIERWIMSLSPTPDAGVLDAGVVDAN